MDSNDKNICEETEYFGNIICEETACILKNSVNMQKSYFSTKLKE